jgi:CBS domain-containing protein
MHKLTLHHTADVDSLDAPKVAKTVDLDSSAIKVVTDFQQVPPVTVGPDVLIDRVHGLMLAAHVRLILVTDPPDRCLGAISVEDISQQRVIREVSQGFSREELTAKDFMRPRASLRAFDYGELGEASIRDVIAALEDSGEQHCLVIDRETRRIRGIISASDIARTLHVPIRLEKAPSFASIFEALHHQLGEDEPLVGFR